MDAFYDFILSYNDSLYHHGIKGQKWGIRRYQNPDGSLTPEGKKRYGDISTDNNSNSVLRRWAIGDHPLGLYRRRQKRERYLEKKVDRLKKIGSEKNITKAQLKLDAQKQKNIDLDKYISNTSTGKLWTQNFIMTGRGADSYRASRARRSSEIRAYVESMIPRLNLHPFNNESIIQKREDKKRYRTLAHHIATER